MATKPPPDVKPAPEESIETKAYKSVEEIPTRETNDRNRLGYHVWRWLTERNNTTLEEQITVSGVRLLIDEKEAKEKILAKLKEMGVELPHS